VSGYAALCLPSAEPDHLVSHLILKSDIRKTLLSWNHVTESNRRPSPYRAWRIRPTASYWVGLPQATGIPVSERVALRLRLPEAVVTWVLSLALGRAAHPGQVRTLVAHEPLVVQLLPDSVQLRVQIQDIYSAS